MTFRDNLSGSARELRSSRHYRRFEEFLRRIAAPKKALSRRICNTGGFEEIDAIISRTPALAVEEVSPDSKAWRRQTPKGAR